MKLDFTTALVLFIIIMLAVTFANIISDKYNSTREEKKMDDWWKKVLADIGDMTDAAPGDTATDTGAG